MSGGRYWKSDSVRFNAATFARLMTFFGHIVIAGEGISDFSSIVYRVFVGNETYSPIRDATCT